VSSKATLWHATKASVNGRSAGSAPAFVGANNFLNADERKFVNIRASLDPQQLSTDVLSSGVAIFWQAGPTVGQRHPIWR